MHNHRVLRHHPRRRPRGEPRVRAQVAEATGAAHWQIVWSEAPAIKPGQKVSKKRPAPPLQAMGFALDELKEARLAPIVSFKGRGKGQGDALPEPRADGAGEAS